MPEESRTEEAVAKWSGGRLVAGRRQPKGSATRQKPEELITRLPVVWMV